MSELWCRCSREWHHMLILPYRVVLSTDGTRFTLVGYVCPNCGENNEKDHNYCKKCGYDPVRKCLSCRQRIPLDTIHCLFCGKSENQILQEREERQEIGKRKGY
ncbi:MAG: double zinc ribbon domain-containing protein [Desulfomonilaceae bacterium]